MAKKLFVFVLLSCFGCLFLLPGCSEPPPSGLLETSVKGNSFTLTALPLNRMKKYTVILTNKDQGELQISSIRFSKSVKKQFQFFPIKFQAGPSYPLKLAPGQSQTFVLQFMSAKSGHFKGELEIIAKQAKNADKDGKFVLKVDAQTVVEPKKLGAWFATNLPGGDSPFFLLGKPFKDVFQNRTFYIYNRGNIDLLVDKVELTGKDADALKLELPKAPFRLAPGLSKRLNVKLTFTPKNNDPFTAKLFFTSPNANNTNANKQFVLTFKTPIPAPIPKFGCNRKLDFGTVAAGGRKDLTCKLENVGEIPLIINKQEYQSETGLDSDYQWTSLEALPITIAPGKSTVLRLLYQPRSNSPSQSSGAFVLHTNIPGETPSTRHRIFVTGKKSP